MSGAQSLLALAFAATLSAWLGISAFAVAGRLLFERRRRRMELGQRLVPRVAPAGAAGHDSAPLDELAGGLSARHVDRVAADASAPAAVATAFARRALRGRRDELLRRAAAHRSEGGRWRRIEALRVLARAGDPQRIPLLERAIADPDRELAGAAVATLGSIEDVRAADVLIHALRTRAHAPSRIAAQLERFPLALGKVLRPLLRDEDPVMRFWGATLLAPHWEEGVEPELAALCADTDASVRAAAVETLGEVGATGAIPAAIALLADPVAFVRGHAARALGDLRHAAAAAQIAPLLGDADWWARRAAKDALEALGPDVVADVEPYLEAPDRFARNGAAEVLQNLGVVDELLAAAARDPRASDAATLGTILAAGGARFTEASLERATPEAQAAVRRLLERADLERIAA